MAKLESLFDQPELEADGVWLRWRVDIEIKLRSTRTPAVRDRLRKIGARLLSGGTSQRDEENLKRIYARHVIVDWRNIQDASGAQVPYSHDTAYNLLANPKLVSLWEWVIEQANSRANFQATEEDEELTEEDEGN